MADPNSLLGDLVLPNGVVARDLSGIKNPSAPTNFSYTPQTPSASVNTNIGVGPRPTISPNVGDPLLAQTRDIANMGISGVDNIPNPTMNAGLANNSLGADMIARGQMSVNREQVRAETQIAAANSSAAALFGVSPGAPSALIAETIAKVNTLQEQRNAVMNDINTATNVDFFTKPLDWIAAQVSLPFKIEKANMLSAQLDQGVAFISKMEAAVKDQATTNALAITAANDAKLRGLDDIALGEALMRKAQGEFTSNGQIIAAGNLLLAENGQKTNLAMLEVQAFADNVNRVVSINNMYTGYDNVAASVAGQVSSIQQRINEANQRGYEAQFEREVASIRVQQQNTSSELEKINIAIRGGHLELAAADLGLRKEAAVLDQKRVQLQERALEISAEQLGISKQEFALRVLNDDREAARFLVQIGILQSEREIAASRVLTVQLSNIQAQLLNTDLQKKQEARDAINERLQKVAKYYGFVPITVEQFNMMENKELKEIYSSAIVDPAVQSDMYGGAPAATTTDSLTRLSRYASNLPEGLQRTMLAVRQMNEQFLTQTNTQMKFKSLTPEERKAETEVFFKNQFAQIRQNVPDTGSIYSLPLLSSFIGNGQMDNSPLKPYLQLRVQANPEATMSPKEIVALTQQAVKEGRMSTAQAAEELSQLYSRGVLVNASVRQFSKLGIPAPVPGQGGYNAMLPSISAYVQSYTAPAGAPPSSSGTIVDMTNKAQLENYLTNIDNRRRSLESITGIPGR
jgi:hypothetical protein